MDRSKACHIGRKAQGFLPCLVMAILLMVPWGPVLAQSGPSSQSRSSRDQYQWNGPINVTLNTSSTLNPFVTVHPDGDLIVVYNREPNEVRWARMDANHTLLSSDNLLTTVNSSLWYMQPTVLVDSKKTIHFFWKDLYGGTTAFYKHMSIDKNGQISHYFNWDFHCIPTFVDGNDYFWCLKLEGHPSAGSPVQNQAYIRRSNDWGNIVMVADVGHNNLDNPAGAVAQGPNNKIYAAYLGMQGTSINFSVVDKDGNILVEPRDQINETGIKNITLVVGTNGTAHIFYARDEPGVTPGEHSIHHVAMSKEGALLYNHTIVSLGMPDFAFITAAGPDPSGNMLVVDGYFPPIDPQWEGGTEYYTTFVGTNGTVTRSREPLTTGCPSRFGTAAMNSSGGFIFVNQDRGCNLGGGGPGVDMTSDVQLYHTGPQSIVRYDLEIVPDKLVYPKRVRVGEMFNISTTIRNNGPGDSTIYGFRIYFTHNGSLVQDLFGEPIVSGNSVDIISYIKLFEKGTWNFTLEVATSAGWDWNLSNNRYFITMTAGIGPDLEVVSVTTDPVVGKVGGIMNISVTVRNLGDLDANFTIYVPQLWSTKMASRVNASSTVVLTQLWNWTKAGTYTCEAMVQNIVPEEPQGKDGNNKLNFTIVVEDPAQPGNDPPTVTIDIPRDGDRVMGETDIEGTFKDPEGDPVGLILFEDGGGLFLAPTINGDRFTFEMDFSGMPEGEHVMMVQACDDKGACSNVTIKVFVSNMPSPPPSRPPSISSWTPQGWALTLGCGIASGTISITVQDPDMDLLKVQWHIDGDNVRTDNKVMPGSSLTFTVLESNLNIGSHNVTVNVGDALSIITMTFNVTVKDPANCGGGGGGGGDPNDTPPQTATESIMNTPTLIIMVVILMIVILASAMAVWRKRTKGLDNGQMPPSPPQSQQRYDQAPQYRPPSKPPVAKSGQRTRQRNGR